MEKGGIELSQRQGAAHAVNPKQILRVSPQALWMSPAMFSCSGHPVLHLDGNLSTGKPVIHEVTDKPIQAAEVCNGFSAEP